MSIVLDGTKGVSASGGLYAANTFTGTYTGGLVADFSGSTGRISVGSGNGITFYNNGVANNALAQIAANGSVYLTAGMPSSGPAFSATGSSTQTLSNATWNGGTIGTGYGGTGLTSFTSGGALYATSTSALTSGTLPASAGGTGNSSYTTGDILYASGSTTFCQGGSVSLTANSGTAYQWSTGATTQAINVTTAGTYTVTVTSAGGTAVSAQAGTHSCRATSELRQSGIFALRATGARARAVGREGQADGYPGVARPLVFWHGKSAVSCSRAIPDRLPLPHT